MQALRVFPRRASELAAYIGMRLLCGGGGGRGNERLGVKRVAGND